MKLDSIISYDIYNAKIHILNMCVCRYGLKKVEIAQDSGGRVTV